MDIREYFANSKAYEQELILREEVLRKPLGFELTTEDMKLDGEAVHVGGFEKNRLVATLQMINVEQGKMKIRQVGVKPSFQKLGLGKMLMNKAEEIAKTQGIIEIELSARDLAAGFYKKLGYIETDKKEIVLTIPHTEMYKKI